MPAIPESTKTSLAQRLRAHARAHWPQLSSVTARYRGPFAYLDGQLPDGEILPLMRLRYGGSAARWGSPSPWPAATATRTRSCPRAPSPAAPKTHSTAPAIYTCHTRTSEHRQHMPSPQPPTDFRRRPLRQKKEPLELYQAYRPELLQASQLTQEMLTRIEAAVSRSMS